MHVVCKRQDILFNKLKTNFSRNVKRRPFLDECYTFGKLEFIGEQRQWHEQLIKISSESPVPDIVGLSHFLTIVMLIVNISFRILLNWYNNNKNTPGGFKGVDVEKIKHEIYSNTDSNDISFVEWESNKQLLELSLERYISTSIKTKSVDVESKRHNNIYLKLGYYFNHKGIWSLLFILEMIKIPFLILLNWYNNNKNTSDGFKAVDIEKIRHEIHSDTDSNDISFVEWEKLEI
ncbi:hypothetical protein BCR32DRAFT_274550 [Anaeromyces robustus]|uniref:Uncharacterized protein n=1 Tax=Anaeromyces robustus TaxID=1754192 RepID=A0A1Y1XP14_9FUNG|nr:hypothetical protein BCR32DRAFT_274550 [Anaeromyces robustus]|eukprot:ORX87405.1 hypothetical protein BCR32DRAFT_274550 [Anaeromyces robustus]